MLLNVQVKFALVPHPSHQTHRPEPTAERPLIPSYNNPTALILRQVQTTDADPASRIGAALPCLNKTQFRPYEARLGFALAPAPYQIARPRLL